MAEVQGAATGGIDQAAIQKLINDTVVAALGAALPTAIAEANKPLMELLGKQQAPAVDPAKAKADAEKPITLADVAKLIEDGNKARAQSDQTAAARQSYAADKLKDLPPAYRNQLGTDPTKFAAEEQVLRSQFQADLKAVGITAPNVSGNVATGQPPAAKVDLSKLNPVQKIALGLKALGTPGAPPSYSPTTQAGQSAEQAAAGVAGAVDPAAAK